MVQTNFKVKFIVSVFLNNHRAKKIIIIGFVNKSKFTKTKE